LRQVLHGLLQRLTGKPQGSGLLCQLAELIAKGLLGCGVHSSLRLARLLHGVGQGLKLVIELLHGLRIGIGG
jgi:hypothetical protein